jgi:hypothetical protein
MGKMDRSGRPTPQTVEQLNAAYDASVATGMKATRSSMLTEYNAVGVGIIDIDDEEAIEKIPGQASMRTMANNWAKTMKASGSDIHDGLMGQYLLVNANIGFIQMPNNALGFPVGTRTAVQLMQEARDTGEDIATIVRRHAKRIKHTTGITWDHGLGDGSTWYGGAAGS